LIAVLLLCALENRDLHAHGLPGKRKFSVSLTYILRYVHCSWSASQFPRCAVQIFSSYLSISDVQYSDNKLGWDLSEENAGFELIEFPFPVYINACELYEVSLQSDCSSTCTDAPQMFCFGTSDIQTRISLENIHSFRVSGQSRRVMPARDVLHENQLADAMDQATRNSQTGTRTCCCFPPTALPKHFQKQFSTNRPKYISSSWFE